MRHDSHVCPRDDRRKREMVALDMEAVIEDGAGNTGPIEVKAIAPG
jgi:hypothetical protein